MKLSLILDNINKADRNSSRNKTDHGYKWLGMSRTILKNKQTRKKPNQPPSFLLPDLS